MPTLMQAATDPAYDFILKHRNLFMPIGPYLGNGYIETILPTNIFK